MGFQNFQNISSLPYAVKFGVIQYNLVVWLWFIIYGTNLHNFQKSFLTKKWKPQKTRFFLSKKTHVGGVFYEKFLITYNVLVKSHFAFFVKILSSGFFFLDIFKMSSFSFIGLLFYKNVAHEEFLSIRIFSWVVYY